MHRGRTLQKIWVAILATLVALLSLALGAALAVGLSFALYDKLHLKPNLLTRVLVLTVFLVSSRVLLRGMSRLVEWSGIAGSSNRTRP